MAEYLDVIDDNGNLTGETVAREVAHRDGIRHRTSHLWLLRKKDGVLQILLQKRSADKPSFPDCYDISSAGHIPAGGEFASSALRELKEELGITAEEKDLIVCGDLELYADGVIRFEKLIDSADRVVEGDKIVTSNVSDKYLPGILIGYISSINVDSNNLTKSGLITPAVDFEHLEEVLVITELKKVPDSQS